MQNYNQKTIRRRKKYCYKKKLFQILTCHLIERSNNKCTTTNKFFSQYIGDVNYRQSIPWFPCQQYKPSRKVNRLNALISDHIFTMCGNWLYVCLKTFWLLSCPLLNTDIERTGSWKNRKRKTHMEQSPQWEHIVIKQFKNKFNTIIDRWYYPAVSWRKARIQNHHLKYFAAKLKY